MSEARRAWPRGMSVGWTAPRGLMATKLTGADRTCTRRNCRAGATEDGEGRRSCLADAHCRRRRSFAAAVAGTVPTVGFVALEGPRRGPSDHGASRGHGDDTSPAPFRSTRPGAGIASGVVRDELRPDPILVTCSRRWRFLLKSPSLGHPGSPRSRASRPVDQSRAGAPGRVTVAG